MMVSLQGHTTLTLWTVAGLNAVLDACCLCAIDERGP